MQVKNIAMNILPNKFYNKKVHFNITLARK
jgi:hypothetical protein